MRTSPRVCAYRSAICYSDETQSQEKPRRTVRAPFALDLWPRANAARSVVSMCRTDYGSSRPNRARSLIVASLPRASARHGSRNISSFDQPNRLNGSQDKGEPHGLVDKRQKPTVLHRTSGPQASERISMKTLLERCMDFQHRKVNNTQNQAIASFGFCPSPEWHDEDEACYCGSFFESTEGGDS